MKKKIILASASPRRRELLTQIGLTFTVMPSDVEENPVSTLPQDIVIELSKEKARDVWEKVKSVGNDNIGNDTAVRTESDIDDSQISSADGSQINGADVLVLSADTVVSIEGEILGKPKDEEDAVRMLSLLSGKEHQVYTGVTMIWISEESKKEEYSFYVCTGVLMYRMNRAEIMEYVRSGEPMDKAGAYGVQGKAAAFIKAIRGEYSNVVGLPVGRLYQEMKAWDLL
ncbi:MAG: septum formation protein Maf [Lachnospiraceae bacterium]|nr:septum formation protein Maf [Lachnospiraceae bacterium]